MDDGTPEVKCSCTLQVFKVSGDLVRDRKTDRSMILQPIASCRFVTVGDVKAAFLLADREEKPKDLST